jgi:hypothetical protein
MPELPQYGILHLVLRTYRRQMKTPHRQYGTINVILFSLLPLFWKNRLGLWDHVAVCVCIPLIVARQRLGRNVTTVTNTHTTIEEWVNEWIMTDGQCVLLSSPIWGSQSDINYYLTVTVFFSMLGAPSDERSGLSFVLVTWTASVQYSKFAAGPRQHSISPYL